MKPVPMEEKLSKEWGLHGEAEIFSKVFEDYSEGKKLSDVLDSRKLIGCSYALGGLLMKFDLKANQLRKVWRSLLNIRQTVDRIKSGGNRADQFESKALLQMRQLKYQLAYAEKRQPQIRSFSRIVNLMIDCVQDPEDYDRLCAFVEAVLAYHKYRGGKD